LRRPWETWNMEEEEEGAIWTSQVRGASTHGCALVAAGPYICFVACTTLRAAFGSADPITTALLFSVFIVYILVGGLYSNLFVHHLHCPRPAVQLTALSLTLYHHEFERKTTQERARDLPDRVCRIFALCRYHRSKTLRRRRAPRFASRPLDSQSRQAYEDHQHRGRTTVQNIDIVARGCVACYHRSFRL